MNPKSSPVPSDFIHQLHPALPGMLFAVLTLLFGFGLGIVFGFNEDIIKLHLKSSATEVRESVYRGNDAAIVSVLEKSWTYMQRAHLHAGGLGATTVGLILLVSVLSTSAFVKRTISLSLGVGSLGYSIYWLWAGFRAPGLGSTGAAKESLKWIAIPSSAAVVVATTTIAALLIALLVRRQTQSAH